MRERKYVARVENGRARVIDECGNGCTLTSDAASAVMNGDEVHVTMKNGKIRVFSARTRSQLRVIS